GGSGETSGARGGLVDGRGRRRCPQLCNAGGARRTRPTALAARERSRPSNLWFEIRTRIQIERAARPPAIAVDLWTAAIVDAVRNSATRRAPAHRAHRACVARTTSAFKPSI